jgi:hypothetical protein
MKYAVLSYVANGALIYYDLYIVEHIMVVNDNGVETKTKVDVPFSPSDAFKLALSPVTLPLAVFNILTAKPTPKPDA